ncbi:MAG: hypothetical protein U0792_25415 [Gemmataceae bacterium]
MPAGAFSDWVSGVRMVHSGPAFSRFSASEIFFTMSASYFCNAASAAAIRSWRAFSAAATIGAIASSWSASMAFALSSDATRSASFFARVMAASASLAFKPSASER